MGGEVMSKPRSTSTQNLTLVNPGAAAIDIGSTMHMAAVNPDNDEMPIRAFGTFTRDLHDLADWFKSCGVTSVAMESTSYDEKHRSRVLANLQRRARSLGYQLEPTTDGAGVS
jgi:hypothetical protein